MSSGESAPGARAPSPEPVRFGIVGCGRIARWHAKQLAALTTARLVGVTDTDPGRRSELSRSSGARDHPSLEELLADRDVEVVSICSPPATHAELVVRAAAAGKHALVEKPLALTLADADRMVAACETHRVLLGAVHQQRARASARFLHDLVSSGKIGRPLFAVAEHAWFRTREQLETDPWRGSATGGGLLHDQAVHAIDLLLWLLGEPAWVSGHSATLAREIAAEDTAAAMVGFADGAVAVLAASAAANLFRDDIAIDVAGTRGGFRLEIRDYDNAEVVRLDLSPADDERARGVPPAEIERLVAGHGGLWRSRPRGLLWRIADRIAGRARGARPFRSPRAALRRRLDRIAQARTGELEGHALVIDRMARAVRGLADPIATGRDARGSIAVIEAILRSSAEGGRRVELSRAGGPGRRAP